MGRKTMTLRALALLLCVCMALAGCGSEAAQPAGERTDANALALELQAQYAADSKVTYTEPERELARDATYTYEIGFDPEEKGIRLTSEIVGVYCDAAFEQAANMASDIETLENGRIAVTLKPGRAPTMALPTSFTQNSRTYLVGDRDAYHQFDLGEFNDWGNAGQYYRVQWLDFETGEPLEKPIVTVFTVRHALAAPTLEWYATANGDGAFRWNAVEGATRYYVCKADWFEGKYSYTSILGYTDGTSWQYDNGDIATVMNSTFVTEDTSEDDKLSAYYDPASYKESEYETYNTYYVMAANDTDTSAASNHIRDTALASTLPYSVALNQRAQDGDYTAYPATIGLLPAQMPITMCDGSTQYRLLNYDVDRVHTDIYQNLSWDDGEEELPENATVTDVTMLVVPYTVDGTLFEGKMAVENFEEKTWKKEMEAVIVRQDALRGRTGDVVATFDASGMQLGARDFTTDSAKKELTKATDIVFGSNALSAYLATAMLAGEEYIPLSAFPEASDMELLADAWNEATYQNPLILGASGASYSSSYNALLVEYDNADTMTQKQKAVRAEVQRVVKKIITPDMTDLEKEMAINQYLCDSAEYDYDALANAEENDFAFVDAKYDDSFTAYGILLNKVGVCASYAASFKLLADAAGLDSIVVTGYLDGSLPHAWNRVNIDGEWKTVDVTNNDNPDLFNALFNLPDTAAALALAEDDRFMMNDTLWQYTASDDSAEYYRLENKYFDTADIAAQLATDLAADGKAVLRTDYDLDDDTFQTIAQDVMTQLGRDNLYGYYWMGVISLSTEAA